MMDKIKSSSPRSSANFSPKEVGECRGGNTAVGGAFPRETPDPRTLFGDSNTSVPGMLGCPRTPSPPAPFCLRHQKSQFETATSTKGLKYLKAASFYSCDPHICQEGVLSQALFHRAQGQISKISASAHQSLGKKWVEDFCAHESPRLCEASTIAIHAAPHLHGANHS